MISPTSVLKQVAAAIPKRFRGNIVVIGSLAAGYIHDHGEIYVRTKDVHCMLSPRVEAVAAAEGVVNTLVREGWTYRASEDWPRPGTATTAEKDLPAVRLNPPDGTD